MFTKPFRTPQ